MAESWIRETAAAREAYDEGLRVMVDRRQRYVSVLRDYLTARAEYRKALTAVGELALQVRRAAGTELESPGVSRDLDALEDEVRNG